MYMHGKALGLLLQPADGTWHAAQVKMDRTIVIEDAGDAQCRYRITGSVKVKMFGIGHLVEKQVMSNSVDSLALLAEVVERCAGPSSKPLCSQATALSKGAKENKGNLCMEW